MMNDVSASSFTIHPSFHAMSARALITGISGFAGSFLTEHLLDRGDAVLGCSQDGAWEKISPAGLQDRVELVAWDLGSPAGIPQEARRRIEDFRPQCIYHLAAISVPEDCGEEETVPVATAINVDGTRRVMELAVSLASRPKVLFASSSHVYGPVGRESPRVDETAPVGPWRGYGRTKLEAEGEVRRAVDRHGCDAVIARSFQHTGPRQNPRMMLSQWARQFATDSSGPVEVFTCDAQVDLTDGRDVGRAYRLLVERGRSGTVYNVGSGVSRRSGDILEMLRHMADPQRPVVELHPGFKQDPIANITRLVESTGWRPEIPLKTTVADTLAWWRVHLRRSE